MPLLCCSGYTYDALLFWLRLFEKLSLPIATWLNHLEDVGRHDVAAAAATAPGQDMAKLGQGGLGIATAYTKSV